MKSQTVTLLVVDDVEANRRLTRILLEMEGHRVVEAKNGKEALSILQTETGPMVGIIDCEMPGLEGIEVCRQARQKPDGPPAYLLLLSIRGEERDILAGFKAGANDYITRPFNQAELLARVKIGMQTVERQQNLINRVKELEEVQRHGRMLSGLLPICCYCKNIRKDRDSWQQVETFIAENSTATFSHGICPECFEQHMRRELEQLSMQR